MLPKISAAVFIRDNNEGAFCLWESMAQLIPLVDEYLVYDFGSTDGTLAMLQDLAMRNPKIRVETGGFPVNPETGERDSGSFATLANDLIAACKHELVLYHQADEIWHDNLIRLFQERLAVDVEKPGFVGYSFWRYQLKYNFQQIKWFPHNLQRLVVRGTKEAHYVRDGMGTECNGPVCSHFDGGWMSKWDIVFRPCPYVLPTHEMVLDVSRNGGFLYNIVKKSEKHAPHWREEPNVEGMPVKAWLERERLNPLWQRKASPFQIPQIMDQYVGELQYVPNGEVLNRIAGAR